MNASENSDAIKLIQVTKSFGDPANTSTRTNAVDNVSLTVGDGQLLVVLGPTGCGKSTTLRLIAGLETCESGQILLHGKPAPANCRDRNLAVVFQETALFPHLSVADNIAFGFGSTEFGSVGQQSSSGVFDVLRRLIRPIARFVVPANRLIAEEQAVDQNSNHDCGIETRVRSVAKQLGIAHLLDRRPHQLSGGERQRVALGRAIVRNPAAFLLDEPLSNVDQWQRTQIRTEIRKIQRQTGKAMIYVTHDLPEALALADRIAVMNCGQVLQTGTPAEIMRSPKSTFVAQFMGVLPINWLKFVPDFATQSRNQTEDQHIVDGQGVDTQAADNQAADDRAADDRAADDRAADIVANILRWLQIDPDSQLSDSMEMSDAMESSIRGNWLNKEAAVEHHGADCGIWVGIRPHHVLIQTGGQSLSTDGPLAECPLTGQLLERQTACEGEIWRVKIDLPDSSRLGFGLSFVAPEMEKRGSMVQTSSAGNSTAAMRTTEKKDRSAEEFTGAKNAEWIIHLSMNQSQLAGNRQGTTTEVNSPMPVIGETIGLKFDSNNLHFFDCPSGQNLRKDLDETK